MRRLCSRPACSLRATAVFGFDPDERVVWLGPLDAPKRAGDLCERHARAMVPPHGWTLDDRRPKPAAPAPAPAPESAAPAATAPDASPIATRSSGKRPTRERADVPLPFDEVSDAPPAGVDLPTAAPEARHDPVTSWTPRFDPDDDLGGLLDAKTPLLSRAFRNDRAD